MRTLDRGKNCRLQYKCKVQHAVFTLSHRKQTKTWTLFRLIEVKLILDSGLLSITRIQCLQTTLCILFLVFILLTVGLTKL